MKSLSVKTLLLAALVFSVICVFALTTEAGVPDMRVADAVVTVYTADIGDRQLYQGTGFVVGEDGIIATNFHVVSQKFRDKDSPLIVFTENGAFIARILFYDVEHDVALLKVKAKGLKSIKLEGSSPGKGDNVTVIGYPLGEKLKVTYGSIRNILGVDQLLQITAPVTYGSSGSPVLNSEGKAVGIVTFVIEDDENVNFALPIRHINRLLEKNQGSRAN